MLDSLKALLQEQVQDLYSAENQLVKALPKMIKAATADSLRAAFTSHLEETKVHVERLQEVAELLETKPGGKKCKAMEGLVAEAAEVLEEDGDEFVIDVALIAAAQRVEHYEMSAYNSAVAIAEQIEEPKIVRLLTETLLEEAAADEKLSEVSIQELLPAARAEGAEVAAADGESKPGKRTKARK